MNTQQDDDLIRYELRLDRANEKLARNLAEVIDCILCTERPRERRVDLIAVQVMSAIRQRLQART
jgi:hypothetical protein